MSTSRVHCNIAFGELIVNFPESHINDNINVLMPVLVDILNDVPFIDFDKCLSWLDWSLPDQLVYSTISALLRLSSSHPQYTEKAASAICFFLSETVEQIRTSDSISILTQSIPAIHGFYRAISSTSFAWTIDQWGQIAARTNELCSSTIVDRLNHLLGEIIQKEGVDEDSLRFVQTFVSRYVTQETQWTVLAQALVPPQPTISAATIEAAAANRAWLCLMRTAPISREISDDGIVNILKSTVLYAMQCFTDLLVQIDEMETEPSIDTYAWETMSESLKLASVCSVALQELDEKLFSRLQLLLSEESPISDNLVQEAALKATTVLVQSFPEIASTMATHLRRFVTSPLPTFEFAFASESRAPPPLVAAAKCLAHCIRLAPGEDLIMSNMYSLLNYIAAAGKDTYTNVDDSQFSNVSIYDSQDYAASQLVETGLRGLSEDEKRLVSISTISVVTRLALEFNTEEVTRLTISMLLQRLRLAEPTVEAAIAYNLVDLALSAPESAFADIIRVFSMINRSANPDDPRFSNNMVLAAQTRLAQELYKRPELYDIYLVELLNLFADKGVAIQNHKIANHEVKTDDMVEQLASLLLPIDALLAHKDFNPQIAASTGVVSLFRNMWFLCVLFQFTNDKDKADNAMNWLKPALSHIAVKTPSMVLEEPHDSVVSDVEYNSVIRQEYAHTIIAKHRTSLTKHISLRASDVRNLSSGQIIFILAMHDIESMRSAVGLPSSLVTYFTNDSINQHPGLSACMQTVAEKVIRDCINELNAQASRQMMPVRLSSELQALLVYTTHRIANAREIASKYLNRLITSFPSLMCDPPFVFAILEVLTLLRQSCENEFLDEYNPVYEFHSERAGITLQMTDDYQRRNKILSLLYRNADTWFELAMARAPIELQSTLQKYLAITQSSSGGHSSELGASVAEHFGKAIGPVERQLTCLASLSQWKTDGAKSLANEIASKSYFSGEVAGACLAWHQAPDKLDKLPPLSAPSSEIQDLKRKMSRTTEDVLNKSSTLTVQDLKRLLFRCAATLLSLEQCDHDLLHHLVALPFEVSTPPAITAGIQVWTWVISNKPDIEVALMAEVLSSWSDNIKHEKGMFSSSLNYQDPFYEPISYSPTDKEVIDRGSANARRMLTPHVLVLQMLFSRLQAARYRRPGMMFLIQHLVLRSTRAYRLMSTHSLAREERFSLLLFGFETLKSSHLDPYSESLLRESLYSVAFAWFSVRPQWSYGANRAQVDADVKVLAEFLSCLQTDSIRGNSEISSLSPARIPSRGIYYANRLRSINHPLRLLTENEMIRLAVWNNPTNDPKRGSDHIGTIGAAMFETTWHTVLRTVWEIAPAIAVYLVERFKSPTIQNEVTKMVRANPLEVFDLPEALTLFIGEKVDGYNRRDFKHLLLWSPVPPVIAIGFFEPRYNNEPFMLQYAHRVLEQHPVDLTFFFVPQVVQALRYDKLGYVARFIFETAKISQLFCHQIIWNMKANCYKDDAAEIEDSMKPVLDLMTERVFESLSGDAREFYNLEFDFFDEVTSISGKLKPFIKRTKPEKKAKIDEEMAKINVNVGVYLPSNPDGTVVDIDKKSGRPLQSHAKAPFMATFKVQKERVVVNTDPDLILDGDGAGTETKVTYDVWQQAIFKVGDDCRQDMLALQIIAMFKNIFTSVGLTLYLFPYRVTATGPGCGVIDVVPNATSRDEMGRAKVNDLLDFFVAKYGREDTVAFQKARLNFIQSMAAYSVACYILQIKDRHNGNIMIDGEGHIVHVDFGFLFDIDNLQGVKFEPNSFKLNHEMVILMGGRYSQGYQLFQNLTVKGFLAIRPHAEQLISTVQLMLDTGLPSFKGEPTIKRLRDRFALGLNERQAAEFMMGIIKNAHENIRSTAYDEFQRLQNGLHSVQIDVTYLKLYLDIESRFSWYFLEGEIEL
ncbi:Phosphatidylinositol 4-kinase stt4 [Termitomyces sp. J132]|nr:Phosphatidylinositol 4-kinase stt4 [Termitomyces sp. J132]